MRELRPIRSHAFRNMNLQRETSVRLDDESARTGYPVEWWFVQGRYAGEGSEPREFMVSLFRHALEWAGLSMGNACTFIGAVLDPSTAHNAVVSRVGPNTVPFLVKASKHYPPPGLDPQVVQVVAGELSDYGPPRPIQVEAKRPVFHSKPFRVQWGDFELSQETEAFVLDFVEPESGRICHFRLRPTHPRFHLAGVEVPDGGAMDYVSYTRLVLEGDVDGKPVSGEAWLDHQWGSQGWVVGGKKKERILGWDWLGIQLDDERELLVMAHRDLKESQTLCQYAVLVDKDGSAHLHQDAMLTPTGWWTSPHTDTLYPVEWHMEVPSLQVSLDFKPLAPDQEIPMLPPIRAVWEGAGRVAGVFSGKNVTGWARLELHGNSYIIDLRKHLDGIVARVRQHLEAVLPRQIAQQDVERLTGMKLRHFDADGYRQMVSAPLWDLMDRDGARLWYSLPGLLMIGALGTDPKPYEKLASVTAEMLRGGAEIVDDIQDNARLRRGEECIHLRYGTNAALCAAHTAFFLPTVLIADYPGLDDSQRQELFRVTTQLCMRAQLGQVQDIHATGALTIDLLQRWVESGLEDRILQIYEGKAASFTSASMEGAAVIARADTSTRAACIQFGITLGLALQIVNDIANFSTSRRERGDCGSDLTEGKVSFVIARALQALGKSKRHRMIEIMCSERLRQDPAILAEAIGLVRQSGALESSKKTATGMLEKEWEQLSKVLPASEHKTMLRVLWAFVLDLASDGPRAEFLPA